MCSRLRTWNAWNPRLISPKFTWHDIAIGCLSHSLSKILETQTHICMFSHRQTPHLRCQSSFVSSEIVENSSPGSLSVEFLWEYRHCHQQLMDWKIVCMHFGQWFRNWSHGRSDGFRRAGDHMAPNILIIKQCKRKTTTLSPLFLLFGDPANSFHEWPTTPHVIAYCRVCCALRDTIPRPISLSMIEDSSAVVCHQETYMHNLLQCPSILFDLHRIIMHALNAWILTQPSNSCLTCCMHEWDRSKSSRKRVLQGVETRTTRSCNMHWVVI